MVDSADPAGPADRYPTFYVAKLMQYFARGGDHLVSSTSDYPLLSMCAAKQASGSLALLVINKSATAALNGNITISNASPATSGTVYSYGIPQDDAAQTGIGSADIASSAVSGLSTNFSYNFPAYSATVIAFGAGAPPPPVRKPDNLIKASGDASYLGEDIFNTDGTGQTRSLSIRAGRSATFIVNTENDGSATDTFTLLGAGSSSPLSVKYYSGASGGTDITSAVTAGTYKLSNVAAGGSQYIHFVVTAAKNARSGTSRGLLVIAISAADTTKRDAVKASASVQ